MSKQKETYKYEWHGSMLTIDEVEDLIHHIHKSNMRVMDIGKNKKTPLCIWGRHGIGKTALPEQVARELGIGFRYISPAQFEEMGDLVGIPSLGYYMQKGNDTRLVEKDLVHSYEAIGWTKDLTKPAQTMFSAPSWVPNVDLGDSEEGFFIIDDANRAKQSILNGIMQLLQDGGIGTWKLPSRWTIIVTANPSGGLYQVNEMDEAQMTRMVHCSMKFDQDHWAKWAAVNDVDSRVINFVLTYPELIKDGEKTTARSITAFSNNISLIKDLKADLGLVTILGKGSLDDNVANAFSTFINDNLTSLINPQDILDAKDFDQEVVIKNMRPFIEGTIKRVDVLNTLSTRLVIHCIDVLDGDLNKKQVGNLINYIKVDGLPNNIRLNMLQDLVNSPREKLRSIVSDSYVAKLVLKKM